MNTGSTIYQRTGYPIGELIKHAQLRARDSKVPVRIELEDGTHLEIDVPEGMR